MKPSNRDHQLELASPLKLRGDPKRLRGKLLARERGLDVSHHAPGSHEGRGENFFLDILFYRVSVMTVF